MKIDPYISELLFGHDCVIVPDFGGFVGNYAPAQVDSFHHKFSPPYKQLSFNKSLTKNDGLLANHIAQEEGINYNQALEGIATYVNGQKALLGQGKPIGIDKVGTLYYDKQQTLHFQPDHSVNYLTGSFGLTSFHSPAIIRKELITETQIAKKIVRKPIDQPPVRQKPIRRVSKLVPYVIAAVPLIAYLVWLPLATDILKPNGSFNYTDLNPFTPKKCAVYNGRTQVVQPVDTVTSGAAMDWMAVPDTISFVQVALFDKDNPLYDDSKKVTVKLREPVVAEPVTTYVATSKPKQHHPFHIIGGCFSVLSNAKRLVAKLKKAGFNAQIIDKHKGLNRVSIQGYPSRQEATTALRSIRAGQNTQAWLLKK